MSDCDLCDTETFGLRGFIRIARVLLVIFVPMLFGCDNSAKVNQSRGSRWATFTRANSGLVDNYINGIYVDADNVIWCATNGGISSYQEGIWSSITDKISYPVYPAGISHKVKCVVQNLDRSMWFGTYGGGIFRYDQSGISFIWKNYTTDDGLPSDVILGLAESQLPGPNQLGEIWCASTTGLGHFVSSTNQGGTWTWDNADNSPLPSSNVYAVAYDFNDYSVWVATYLPVALTFIDATGRWQPPIPLEYPYDVPIVAMAFDASNNLWVAQLNQVSKLNVNTFVWEHYTYGSTNGGLPLGSVNCVTTDFAETRWFGTNSGLARYRDTTWTTFNSRLVPQLPSDTITAVAYDREGNLWIGTHEGVVLYNEEGILSR